MGKSPFEIKCLHRCGGAPPVEVLTGKSSAVLSDTARQGAIFHQTAYLSGNVSGGGIMKIQTVLTVTQQFAYIGGSCDYRPAAGQEKSQLGGKTAVIERPGAIST